jgi:hypothetical protein
VAGRPDLQSLLEPHRRVRITGDGQHRGRHVHTDDVDATSRQARRHPSRPAADIGDRLGRVAQRLDERGEQRPVDRALEGRVSLIPTRRAYLAAVAS